MKKYLNFALIGFLALVMIGSGFNKLRKYNELPSPNFLIEKYSNNSIEYNLKQEGFEIKYKNKYKPIFRKIKITTIKTLRFFYIKCWRHVKNWSY